MRRAAPATAGLVLAVGLTGCAAAGPDDGAAPERREVVVLAAASLTDVLTQVARDLEAQHDGVTVTLGFGGSSALAQQVVSGAPADVLVTASPETMARVVDAGLAATEPTVLARNRLQLAVPAGNPAGVRGLVDLADEDLAVALCAEQVPCGAAARAVLDAAGVTAAPDTVERDARATLTKVRLGEVDAALVYRTDVLAAGDEVEGLDTPEAAAVANDYEVVVLDDAGDPDAAQAFADHVLGPDGREVLARAGFETP